MTPRGKNSYSSCSNAVEGESTYVYSIDLEKYILIENGEAYSYVSGIESEKDVGEWFRKVPSAGLKSGGSH